jgi:hypothetical protein
MSNFISIASVDNSQVGMSIFGAFDLGIVASPFLLSNRVA